ncbi:MAG: hypothetical protein HY826_11590 [Actinobacteria bacterium]|nr:hypothetical protein [Actinomycetota bacterium]
MIDQAEAAKADLLVRLVLAAVEQRLVAVREETAKVAAAAERHQQEVARLASELSRWLTANARAEAAMSTRLDELQEAVERLSRTP